MTTTIVGYGRTGILQIGSIVLNGPAWDIPDLGPLWIGGDLRGDDRLIPGTAGVLPFRRRRTVTTYQLDMVIVGMVDQTGAAYEDAMAGLELNMEVLRAGVVEPTNVGDGTRAAILTMPSGDVRNADVHVNHLELGAISARRAGGQITHASVRGSLELSVPAGRFV